MLVHFLGAQKKDEFVTQPFLTNCSGFIHQKRFFFQIKNSIFAPKYTRYGKNVKKQKYLCKRNFQIFQWPFFNRCYIFCLLLNNVIKNKNFWFPKKLYKIREKFSRQNSEKCYESKARWPKRALQARPILYFWCKCGSNIK